MGIYIPNMEMPKSCEDCPLVEETENFFGDIMSRECNLIYKGYTSEATKGRRRDDCPLVPLPEGHGRLIDETELIAKLVCHCKDLRKLSTKTIGETIGLCATIVPAEGGTDECSEN